VRESLQSPPESPSPFYEGKVTSLIKYELTQRGESGGQGSTGRPRRTPPEGKTKGREMASEGALKGVRRVDASGLDPLLRMSEMQKKNEEAWRNTSLTVNALVRERVLSQAKKGKKGSG